MFNRIFNREQRVVLNCQTSDWRKTNSGVPQWSVLDPRLFLTDIDNLPDRITLICKIFADVASFFSKVIDTSNSQNALNSDLESISNGAYQLKLQFNPNPKEQANEITLSHQSNTYIYPPSHSITIPSLNVLISSTWVSFLIPNLTLTFILNKK